MENTKYKTVLLIDDNDVDNFVNQKIIGLTGFAKNIVVRQTARGGLQFLAECKIDDLPDIIFLDILMPVMDGFEFLDEFDKLSQPIRNKCKVIMLSTSESFKDLNRANKNKYVYKFLNKPLTEGMLRAVNL